MQAVYIASKEHRWIVHFVGLVEGFLSIGHAFPFDHRKSKSLASCLFPQISN